MELRDKTVLIVGFERTGEALCRFLLDRGACVRVTEKKAADAFGDKVRIWTERGVVFETGGHRRESFLGADLIVPSPGVSPIAEILAARDQGIPVISEIELASRFLLGKIVGITGSNGKSTTTTLIHKILTEAGLKSRLAGNIGTPLISFVGASRDDHIYVTEISSFQLEYAKTLTPAIAAVLNVSENHIDWHGTFENYFGAKKKLVLRQGPEGRAVLNRDNPLAWGLAAEAASEVHGFSRRRRLARGAFLEDGWIVVREGASKKILRASEVPLPGTHNLENVLAAALIGHLMGVQAPALRRSIRSFHGLEHRLEDILRIGGVRFVNDSKATTVDATLKALASFNRPIVLILGGRGKGGDFSPLRKEVRKRVRSVVLVGEAADKIEAALGGAVPVARASTYREVVHTAFSQAARGDVVLLSPACTSWDMFRDFEERGRTFKREVHLLAAGLRKKGARR